VAGCLALGAGVYEWFWLKDAFDGLLAYPAFAAGGLVAVTLFVPAAALLLDHRGLASLGLILTTLYIPPMLLAIFIRISIVGSGKTVNEAQAFIEGAFNSILIHAVIAVFLFIAVLPHKASKAPATS
jgi:hypothetical protein